MKPSRFIIYCLFTSLIISTPIFAEQTDPISPKEDGYRGIWFTLGQQSEAYGDKYAGGLGTYTAKHIPIAVYAPRANKTFFVYGGTIKDKQHLLIMAGYYDHEQGVVPRPTIVHDKQGVKDPHDNASLCLDDQGYIWVFVSGRGRARPGFKYRSNVPFSIDKFDLISTEELTYPQPWYVSGSGFLHLFTKYTKGRELYWETSADGESWSDDNKLAGFGGHYQSSRQRGNRIVTAFNYHPNGQVDKRTNLYFLQTEDFGKTWTTIEGKPVTTPLNAVDNPALVRDYAAEDLLVYMKDVNFDADGNPVILYITSRKHTPGPEGDPRYWTIAHWNGSHWQYNRITRSDHNYDMGSLYIEDDGSWRVIGPTEDGPQVYGTGGEMALWISEDQGQTWRMEKRITSNSRFNHSYARRPVSVHPDFYALWADGDAFNLSESRLYFTNRTGDEVFILPPTMSHPFEKPIPYPQHAEQQ